MAAITPKNNILKFTADNDTFTTSGKTRFKGGRLIAGVDAATAVVKITDTNGAVVYHFSANAANAVDECNIEAFCEGGVIHVDMTGTSPILLLYLM